MYVQNFKLLDNEEVIFTHSTRPAGHEKQTYRLEEQVKYKLKKHVQVNSWLEKFEKHDYRKDCTLLSVGGIADFRTREFGHHRRDFHEKKEPESDCHWLCKYPAVNLRWYIQIARVH